MHLELLLKALTFAPHSINSLATWSQCYKTFFFVTLAQFTLTNPLNIGLGRKVVGRSKTENQGILTEGEGSVRLTSLN
jgi:hypothetical protein